MIRILAILSKLLPPKLYLWIRYRLDKYMGWKGLDPKEILHFYWKNPEVDGGANLPQNYLPNEKNRYTSALLVETISKYVDKNASILELGCNVGRNLEFLRQAGFECLSGVEINEKAIELLKETFPELAKKGTIIHSSIEDFFNQPKFQESELIFTSAVLEHLSQESESIFDRMANSAKRFIVTLEIENEDVNFHRIKGRRYKEIFESKGFRSIEEKILKDSSPLKGYTLRVFKRASLSVS